MGHWGVKSYENDDAGDALDSAFDRVHGEVYDDLMDDRNPMTVEQIHKKLANPATLAASVDWLKAECGDDFKNWDDTAKLAFAGVVVLHAEMAVKIPDELRDLATVWLDTEEIEWDEATLRKLRKDHEIAMLRRLT